MCSVEKFHQNFPELKANSQFSDTIGTYSHYVYSLMDTTDSGRITFTVKIFVNKLFEKYFKCSGFCEDTFSAGERESGGKDDLDRQTLRPGW